MSTRRERAKAPSAQLNRQLVEQNELKEKHQAQSRKNLHTAEIYFDIAKLIFGGVVIGTLLERKEYWELLLVFGTIWFIVLLWISNNYYNKGNKNISV